MNLSEPIKNFFKPKVSTESVVNNSVNQKFGTFLGVYVPCILMLFGVIIFLRLGWVVGLAGLSNALIIITLAASIALVTTLSMSSIATNTEVGKGGVYYMLSRSLGLEVGVSIGLPLFFRQSLTVAFCCIGFAESLHDLIPSWSITNIAITTLACLTLLAYTSVRGALKVQLVIFIAIIASLISLFTGNDVAPINPETFTPSSLNTLGFWALFAIFFPAMTGMESSVSLSGDLKNPSRSLPIGTISAILSAYFIYIGIALFLIYRVPVDQLVEDPLIIQKLASVPSLIIVGIWGATLSSALGGLLAAPRTLQAIAEDGMAPKVFAKTFGPMCEPKVATLATCLIALVGTYFGSVNILAPLLTMISLISYSVLNLSAGMETLMANPSWRPRFRVHWIISLSGAFACLLTMLMIDVGVALLAIFLIATLYFFVKTRNFESALTDIRDGLLLFFSRSAIYSLAYDNSPSKSWRPHFLVFAETADENSASLLKFAQGISQSKGFLTTASFVEPGSISSAKRKQLTHSLTNRFKQEKIHTLVQIKEAEKVTIGMQDMIEHYGLGPLTPNTIIFGGIKKEVESIDFVKMMELSYRRHKNVIILNKAEKTENLVRTNIHIWWDDSSKSNSELMLVLGYMLQMDRARKRSRLCIKATAFDELDRKHKLQKLEQISLEKRLPLNIEVLVSLNEAESRLELVKEFSKDADMIFMGLQTPPRETNKVEEYSTYLQALTSSYEGLPLVFVLSSESNPLENILE